MMASEKKPFALRIDAGMLGAIEKWASDEFRSVNGQIEWILYKALRESGRVRGGKEEKGGQKDGQEGETRK
jgi:hypothetical protein